MEIQEYMQKQNIKKKRKHQLICLFLFVHRTKLPFVAEFVEYNKRVHNTTP